jgi:hypothetical protein
MLLHAEMHAEATVPALADAIGPILPALNNAIGKEC